VKRFSDEEFLEAWNRYKRPALVSVNLGLDLRGVYARRREIEKKYKISLKSSYGKGESLSKYDYITHEDKLSFDVQNGCVIVFSDAHFWPGIKTTAYLGMLRFIRKMKPAIIINNGDCFDGASISRHSRIGWQQRPTVKQELDACKEHLTQIEKLAGKSKLIWPMGNHDARFESRLAANAPEFEGVEGSTFAYHFPKWNTCWSTWINDKVVVKHRFKNGVHATHNNTLWAGKTMVTGHLHSLKVTPFDDYNGTRWGVDTGTLAEPSGPQFSDYLEKNPTNWRSGFVVLTFVDGELLWPEIARVVGKAIDFRGELIQIET
jgi:hypothetical protein